jgi:hypothetical protein
MGSILKSFFIGFFTVFFYKSHVYKQRERDRWMQEISQNTRK